MLVVKDKTTEKLVFIHLQKCAGTFINEFLKKAFPLSYRPFKAESKTDQQHIPKYILSSLNKIAPRIDRLPSFGSIRNPLSFYSSIYHFSKEKANEEWASGSIHNRLGRPESFSEYIEKLFKNESIKNSNSKTGHAELFQRMEKLDIGVLSARYLSMFFDKNIFDYSIDDIIKHHNNMIKVNHIIRVENLSNELYAVLKKSGLKGAGLKNPDTFKNIIKESNVKKNKSSHNHYKEYYNEDLINLIKHKERLIFNIYRY
jgi:hypothetical protein